MKRKVQFSILRLTPDASRGETVNVGLVAFHEKSTDMRLVPTLPKIKSLDPNLSPSLLEDYEESMRDFFEDGSSIEDRHAVLVNFPTVSATELGYFMLDESEDYEAEIQKLLLHFVYTPRKERVHVAQPTSRIQSQLRKLFEKAGILGAPEEINEHRVVPNFIISEEENLRADFALKNGRYHISETIDFRVSEKTLRDKTVNLVGMKAVTLDRAVKVLGEGTQPIAIYAAHPGHEDIVDPAIALLGNYAEKIFNINKPREMAAYTEYMFKAAGIPQVHHAKD